MSTNNDPLWIKIVEVFWAPWSDRKSAAAIIRAIADEVVPEETWLGTDETCFAHYSERKRIRKRLLAEAERAEAGR